MALHALAVGRDRPRLEVRSAALEVRVERPGQSHLAAAASAGVDPEEKLADNGLGPLLGFVEREHVGRPDGDPPAPAANGALNDEILGIAHPGAENAEAAELAVPIKHLIPGRIRRFQLRNASLGELDGRHLWPPRAFVMGKFK